MSTTTLSPAALATIHEYLHLPFPNRNVACPYYNNRRSEVRGALRVLVGKGSVKDIMEECTIFSLKEKIDVKNLSNEDLKKFLIDHHIGIDCSGLAYYVLGAELTARSKKNIASTLFFPQAKNPIRKILTKLRPAEHTNVETLAHPKNSQEVSLSFVRPGDMVIMLGSGEKHDRDHVLIVHEVTVENNLPTKISYTHALAWTTDGKYHHGVRQGTIHLTPTLSLLEATWEENGKQGHENETYLHATWAKTLIVRRLRCLQ